MQNIIKKFGIFVLGAVSVALMYAAGVVSDPLVAAQMLLNPEKAVTQAVSVLNDTPKDDIVPIVMTTEPALVPKAVELTE